MKRLCILLPALCLCLSLLLCSCASEATPSSTADGALTELKDENGSITGYERRYHNLNGDLSRLDCYDAQQNYLSYVLYAYDSDNRLSTETYYAANGIAQSRTVYTYSEDGKLSEKAFELPNGEATVEVYDADGAVVEKLYYGTDEQLFRRDKLENGAWKSYDAEWNPIIE